MSDTASERKPNFIVIFCDDLGYGDLSCYGSERNHTPRLDQMAAEGTRFTDFYVASPVCSPSRSALMTGCYPKRIGLDRGHEFGVLLPGDPIGLHPDEITIASLLKDEGYTTKMIGKWHLGDQPEFMPTRHGFDDYFGLPYSNDMLPDHPGNNRYRFPPLMLMRNEDVAEVDPNQVSLTDRYLVEAQKFIRANKDEPFFLYLAHMYVHVPIYAPMRFNAVSKNGPYGAAVAHVDYTSGAILDTLCELGIAENTLVLFTSDNGAAAPTGPRRAAILAGRGGIGSNLPLRGGKGSTWEGGMREPFIAWWPGTVPAGRECREVCTSMDLLPTFAHLAGGAPPDDRVIDGKDIRPLLTGEEGAKSPYDAFFYYNCGNHGLNAVRAGKWKLHLDRDELYDLEADIGETTDLFQEYPDIVAALRAKAETCRDDLGDGHTGAEGRNCRPVGRVANPTTILPVPDPDDLWVKAAYD